MRDKAGRLTPIPLDTPVITYTDMLGDFELKISANLVQVRWYKECDVVKNKQFQITNFNTSTSSRGS